MTLRTAEDFDRKILNAISSSNVVIAAISDAWVGERRFRKPRICEDGDWVRKELEHGLASGIPVIPVLISGAKVPDAHKLPPSLHGVFEELRAHPSIAGPSRVRHNGEKWCERSPLHSR